MIDHYIDFTRDNITDCEEHPTWFNTLMLLIITIGLCLLIGCSATTTKDSTTTLNLKAVDNAGTTWVITGKLDNTGKETTDLNLNPAKFGMDINGLLTVLLSALGLGVGGLGGHTILKKIKNSPKGKFLGD